MRRIVVGGALGLALAAQAVGLVQQAGAGTYPESPIKFIVPWAAGGDTDVIKRVFANMLQKDLGRPVVVTNITGASATVGAREAKNSPPDGYTIYSVHDSIHSTYYTGVTEINYPDFDPVCLVASTPAIVAVYGKSKWSTLKELLEDARRRPGEVKVGATLGSTSHFFPALIEREAKVKWKYVSYEGTAPRMTALLGGHIDMGESNLTQTDKTKAGHLRFLGIATEKRHPEAPDLPTLKEAGVNVTYAVNRGVLAPKGTPEPALARLEAACEKVSKDPVFAETMRKHGTDVQFLGRQAYAEFLKKNDRLNKDLAAELGLLKRK